MKSRIVFSRQSDEWQTPRDLFDRLNKRYQFNADAAANETNHLLPEWYGPGSRHPDTLHVRLGPGMRVFCNPPYSRAREFVGWAARQADLGAIVVMLLPSRTDTRWFHDHIWSPEGGWRPNVAAVEFIKGRLKFGGSKNGAPFPSMVVEFRRPQ